MVTYLLFYLLYLISVVTYLTVCLHIFRSVQMRIYSMHKGEFVMVFIAFFACFGLGVFIGLAGKIYL